MDSWAAEDDMVTGSAADLIPESEPEKIPEPGRSEDENQDEPGEGDIETMEIIKPASLGGVQDHL